MESLSNVSKRKKRKTRKWLNEIRDRSRRTVPVFEKDDSKLKIYSKNIHKFTITNNRLTLRMFPKAIQSKIITRPTLLELEQKSTFKLNEVLKENNVSNQSAARVRISREFDNNNELLRCQNLTRSDLEDSTRAKEPIVSNTEDREDVEVFSSLDELDNKSPTSIRTQSVSTIISSSTQSVHEDNGYNLYKEFMSEVPACLQQNAKLIHEDVMKKTKILLQNLFLESCYQECEDNILKCIKDDSKNNAYFTSRAMVHDPMSYIRLSQVQQRHQLSNISQSLSESSGISHSSPRPSSCLTSPLDTPFSVIVHDTPDYTYYPHRLN